MTTLESLLQLPVAERIQLVEDLWDSIAADASEVVLTAAQRQEIEHRIQTPSSTTYSFEEVLALSRSRK